MSNGYRIPSVLEPIADGDGRITQSWFRFLNPANPASSEAVSLTGSPFDFKASVAGHLLVKGGTVSSISITRGRDTIPTGLTQGFIPVSQSDTVTVAYSAAPTLTFLEG